MGGDVDIVLGGRERIDDLGPLYDDALRFDESRGMTCVMHVLLGPVKRK